MPAIREKVVAVSETIEVPREIEVDRVVREAVPHETEKIVELLKP